MRNNNFSDMWFNRRDYENLMTFQDVFPDVDEFIKSIEDYIWFEDINSAENKILLNKWYKQVFNRYRNTFFRFNQVANIAQKTASHLEQFLRYDGAVEKLVKELKAGNISYTEKFLTDNTEDSTEVQDLFRTEAERITETDWKALTEQQLASVIKVAGFEKMIAKYGKSMFMNKTREYDDKTLLTKGGI